jgi:hypothetical protein
MREIRILNLGAGVQSTTLYLMFSRGVLTPTLDAAIFADTQEEPEDVNAHVAWLRSLGGIPILVPTAGKLGDDLVHGRNTTGGRFAAIPAFTTKDGGEDPRHHASAMFEGIQDAADCANHPAQGAGPAAWAPRPARRACDPVRRVHARGRRARHASRCDVQERASLGDAEVPADRPVDDRVPIACAGWSSTATCRTKCRARRASSAPTTPDEEWLRIKQNPRDWARAVEVDRALRAAGSVANRDMRQVMYLHVTCRPLEDVDFKPAERKQIPLSFYRECEGVCGV